MISKRRLGSSVPSRRKHERRHWSGPKSAHRRGAVAGNRFVIRTGTRTRTLLTIVLLEGCIAQKVGKSQRRVDFLSVSSPTHHARQARCQRSAARERALSGRCSCRRRPLYKRGFNDRELSFWPTELLSPRAAVFVVGFPVRPLSLANGVGDPRSIQIVHLTLCSQALPIALSTPLGRYGGVVAVCSGCDICLRDRQSGRCAS